MLNQTGAKMLQIFQKVENVKLGYRKLKCVLQFITLHHKTTDNQWFNPLNFNYQTSTKLSQMCQGL